MKRVSKHEALNSLRDFLALAAQCRQKMVMTPQKYCGVISSTLRLTQQSHRDRDGEPRQRHKHKHSLPGFQRPHPGKHSISQPFGDLQQP